MSQDSKKAPVVPDGWLAKFDDKYSTWYYVDLATKKSQWEAPKGTRFDTDGSDVAPPPYNPNSKSNDKNNSGESRSGSYGGGHQGGYGGGHQGGYGGGPQGGYGGGPQGGYGGGYGGPQGGYGGGYGGPQGGYGGYPPQGGYYGGYPPQGGYGGYPPQPQYAQQQGRKSGMGGMGGMAMGAGAGLLGGALLANSFDHMQEDAYQDGFQDGADFDGGGGDF